MKKPWLALTAICSIVVGIVLISVIFGSYSSLLRAQNRISAAKDLMSGEVEKRLALVPELESLSKNPKDLTALTAEASNLFQKIKEAPPSLPPDLAAAFAVSQQQLGRGIQTVLAPLAQGKENPDKTQPLIRKFDELETTIYMTSRRYNKEARYFNSRKEIFPGFVVAKLFGFETQFYPEIDDALLKPAAEKADQGGS